MDSHKDHLKGFGDPAIFFPGISIDCVIIGFDLEELNILLMKWKDQDLFVLPGGFVMLDEDMDQSATRILEQRTGIKLPFLKQFYTFGDVQRREKDMDTEFGSPQGKIFTKMADFLKHRFITTGYLSLVNMQKTIPSPDYMSDHCFWVPVKKLPELVFDHNDIVSKALNQLRTRINYLPVGIALLPDKFTMKEFQTLYERILGKNLDRGNFQKKILKLGILERHEKQLLGQAHKAPYLYSFNRERYDELLEQGIGYMN
jgi:hypothetical protein